MRIELVTLPEHLRTPFPTRCGICNLRFQTGRVVAEAYGDGVDWTQVCPKCLERGEDGIAERLRSEAEWHRKVAEEMEEAAAEGVEYVPTPEELRLMELLV
jgi:hypothetical protein